MQFQTLIYVRECDASDNSRIDRSNVADGNTHGVATCQERKSLGRGGLSARSYSICADACFAESDTNTDEDR